MELLLPDDRCLCRLVWRELFSEGEVFYVELRLEFGDVGLEMAGGFIVPSNIDDSPSKKKESSDNDISLKCCTSSSGGIVLFPVFPPPDLLPLPYEQKLERSQSLR